MSRNRALSMPEDPLLGLSVATATVVGPLLIPVTPAIMTAITPTEPLLMAKASRFAVPQVLCGVFRVLGAWWRYPIGNALASGLAIGWFFRGPWRRSLVEPR